VDSRVLIPRPETEILVGQVLDRTAGRTGLSAVDIGTGSGAIALSLAVEGGFDRIVATDASAGALDLARENAARCGLAGRVEFRLGDVWEALGDEAGFDVVVSNPPYVAESEGESLHPEVRKWEPASALFAGPDGLAVLFRIVDGARDRLSAGGLLALEIGEAQGAAVLERIRDRGYGDPRLVQDLAGRPRIVLATRTPIESPRSFMAENLGDS